MKREMQRYGLPEPEFYEERDSFKVIFKNNHLQTDTQSGIQSDTQSGIQSDTQSGIQSDTQRNRFNTIQKKILEYCIEPRTSKEIRDYIGISSKSYVATNILKPMIDSKELEYTNKNSTNARNQKYVTYKR